MLGTNSKLRKLTFGETPLITGYERRWVWELSLRIFKKVTVCLFVPVILFYIFQCFWLHSCHVRMVPNTVLCHIIMFQTTGDKYDSGSIRFYLPVMFAQWWNLPTTYYPKASLLRDTWLYFIQSKFCPFGTSRETIRSLPRRLPLFLAANSTDPVGCRGRGDFYSAPSGFTPNFFF
jgi:hypothetical protein